MLEIKDDKGDNFFLFSSTYSLSPPVSHASDPGTFINTSDGRIDCDSDNLQCDSL